MNDPSHLPRHLLRCIQAFIVATCTYFCATARGQMSAEKSLSTLRADPAMEVQLYASEPMITNPSAIDVDSKGRVWVAEIQWYRDATKNPAEDKIKVLEDTDGDGRADKVTVFADGLVCPMSVCVAGHRVYSFIAGDLLMWEDKNDDLKPDGPPKKILTGFSPVNHDHTAHSMMLGPDHKWYMSHGDEGFHVTGTDGSYIEHKYGAMIRGELDGSKLELMAGNFRNPYEMCVNSFGEGYCSDNDNDGNQSTRVCWLIEGGDYGWFGGPLFKKNELDARVPRGIPFREHWHFRGYLPGYVPATIVTGFGSPCGICFYEGDAFGPKFKNVPMHCDPGPREVRIYPHENEGFGMRGRQETFLTTKGDNYFRPDDICTGPDGSLYVSDWYDGGVGGHGYNDPDRGRIFRIVPTGKKLKNLTPPGPYTTIDAALEALCSPNLDTQFQAREKLLAEGEKSIAPLAKLANDTNADPNFRARALWLLDRIGLAGQNEVKKYLTSKDDQFRALAVKILARHGVETSKDWLTFCTDSSPIVAREALLGIGRLAHLNKDKSDVSSVVKSLTEAINKYDGTDRYQLEILNIAAQGYKKELATHFAAMNNPSPKLLPLIQLIDSDRAGEIILNQLVSLKDQKKAAEWIAMASRIPNVEVGKSLLGLISNEKLSDENQNLLLAAIVENIDSSWSEMAKNPELKHSVYERLKKKGCESESLKAIRKLGWNDRAGDILKMIGDKKLNEATRIDAIATSVELQLPHITSELQKHVSDSNEKVRQSVWNSLITIQDMNSIKSILLDEKFIEADRQKFLNSAMDSLGVSLGLLKLIDQKSFSDKTTKQILSIAVRHPDSSIRGLFERYLPENQRAKKLGETIKADDILKLSGNIERGKQIFTKSSAAQCKNCHMIDGVGGTLGPDLSLIGKKFERASLLETILKPSKAIAHGYETFQLDTKDGKTYVGFLIEKSDKQVILKNTKQEIIRVPHKNVEELIEQKISLMPELVLQEVSAQDAADLLAYMTSLTQGITMASEFKIIGPFHMKNFPFNKAHSVEEHAENPDLEATHAASARSKIRWDTIRSDGLVPLTINIAEFDKAKRIRDDRAVHFLLVYADSLTDQKVELQITTGESIKTWVNGKEFLNKERPDIKEPYKDAIQASLKRGRNVILLKLANDSNASPFSLGVKSSEPITLQTK